MHGLGSLDRLLAAFADAATAEVERMLLRLLTRFGVDDHLAYRHPAIVAGVGAIMVAVIMVSSGGRWMRYSHGRQPPCRLAGSRGVRAPAGPFPCVKRTLTHL